MNAIIDDGDGSGYLLSIHTPMRAPGISLPSGSAAPALAPTDNTRVILSAERDVACLFLLLATLTKRADQLHSGIFRR
jgi:hypothetical protein